ncbi:MULTISPECIES: LTA synthase family protein [Bacillaceae]|uniref:LTA synthase family protein n=1 Tax=Evansella alkalicola TaxID=745819 RepID=A0ABS6JY80_9BACI|nr:MULTISPECIES: LTA synthase family protein [Bacillaceae]MBU9722609.1 LTA synthase family protein [Bacillus alkalicola]
MLIYQNMSWIIAVFIPVIILLIFQKNISFEKKSWRFRSLLIGAAIAFHLLGIGAILASGQERQSAHDLYFNNSNSVLSMERLGLVTSMRIDLQRQLTGWSPSLEVTDVFVSMPVATQEEPILDRKIVRHREEETISDIQPLMEEEIQYHAIDTNFESLIDGEDREEIIEMHQYFDSVPPTAHNDFTGIFEGFNLILITAEALAPYAIHEEVTPTLHKLANEGYQFTNFYTPLWEVSTSDGEYVAMTGLIPKSGTWSFQQSSNIDLPFVMGNQLNDIEYKTMAYHNHTYDYYYRDISHPNLGYHYKGIGNGLVIEEAWPRSDLEMFEVTIPEYMEDEPFHAYYMTVSGHLQYNFGGNQMAMKNRKYVEDLPISTQGKAYLATQIELDLALEHLLEKLEGAGVAEKTVIAISADHYPYGLDNDVISEFIGHPVDETFELHQAPFILYHKGIDSITIDKPSSSLDILPTLLNLFGLEYDSRLLMGRDIFSNEDPLVIFQDKSFITDKGKYNAITQEFIPNDSDIDVDSDYIDWISAIIDSKFYYSRQILDNDYYRIITEKE